MISKEQIKEVEKLQNLERKVEMLKEDYIHLDNLCSFSRLSFDSHYFNFVSNYKKVLKIYIKNAIRKTEREIKKMKGE